MLWKQSSENVFVFRRKDCWAQIHDKLVDEERFGTSLICAFIQSYCVKFAGHYDEARD